MYHYHSLFIYFGLFFRLIIGKNSSDCANTFLYETDLRIEDMGTFSYFHEDIIFVYIFRIEDMRTFSYFHKDIIFVYIFTII